MRRRRSALVSPRYLLVLTLLIGAGLDLPAHGQFQQIRIGDVDGLGFDDAAGELRASVGTPCSSTLPANVDLLNVLTANDFIPDLDCDGRVGSYLAGNNFDHRSPAERAGSYVEGVGFSGASATVGSQFTDISLSNTYDVSTDPLYNFPTPPSITLPNQPGFEFGFYVTPGDVSPSDPLYLNVVFADYDVNPASIQITRADNSTSTINLTTSPPGSDGLIQAAYAVLTTTDVFDQSNGGNGYLVVDFLAPNEPYTAFDYVEISTERIGDCNDNGVDDAIDISTGTSQDDDGDGVPDECLCVALIDFEVLHDPGTTVNFVPNTFYHSESGFDVEYFPGFALGEAMFTVGDGHSIFGRSTAIFGGETGATQSSYLDWAPVKVDSSTEALFSVCRLDLAEGVDPLDVDTVPFTADLGAIGTKTVAVSLDGDGAYEPQRITFDEFEDIRELRWESRTIANGAEIQVDNICICNVTPRCAPEPPAMIAWWAGDDCRAADKRPLLPRHPGSSSSWPAACTDALVGAGAMPFDGSLPTVVTVPHDSVLEPGGSGDFTVVLWLEPDLTALTGDVDVVAKSGAYRLYLSSGVPTFEICTSVGTCPYSVAAPSSIADNDWHFVAATLSRSANSIDLTLVLDDGVSSQIHVAPPGQFFASSFDLLFGSSGFTGYVDELQLYAAALDPGVLQSIFWSGSSGLCSLDQGVIHMRGQSQGGGSIYIDVGDAHLVVPTSPGEGPSEVARRIAQAVNADASLASLHIYASALDDRVIVTNTAVLGLSSTDPGLLVSLEPFAVSVPGTTWWGQVLLAGGFLLVATGVLLKRSRSRVAPT